MDLYGLKSDPAHIVHQGRRGELVWVCFGQPRTLMKDPALESVPELTSGEPPRNLAPYPRVKDEHRIQEIRKHWERPGLSDAILSALTESGKSLDALTIDDLAPLDQFHGGGKRLTSTRIIRWTMREATPRH